MAGWCSGSRGRLYDTRWLLRAMVVMGPAGFIAILAGWTVTEVGRQPFTVYGMLRTADSVSPIALPGVATSLAAFAVVYFIVFGAGFMFILRMMHRPPAVGESGPPKGVPVRRPGITPAPRCDEGRPEHPVATLMTLPADLGRADRVRGAGLCAARRLRPRHRPPVRRRARGRGPGRDGQHHRPGLGRQRDLARARRRRPVRRVPARLRHHHAGDVSHRSSRCCWPGVPGRRVRVPLPRRNARRARDGGTAPSCSARSSRPSRRG